MLGIVELNEKYFKTELNELEYIGAVSLATKMINEYTEFVYGEKYDEKLELVYRAVKGEKARLDLMYDIIIKISGSYYLISYISIFGTDRLVLCCYESDENGNVLESDKTIYIVSVA